MKSLLVTLNHSPQLDDQPQLALQLTDQFNAHLTGVYGIDYACNGNVMW